LEIENLEQNINQLLFMDNNNPANDNKPKIRNIMDKLEDTLLAILEFGWAINVYKRIPQH
jgi:hypothetical protein